MYYVHSTKLFLKMIPTYNSLVFFFLLPSLTQVTACSAATRQLPSLPGTWYLVVAPSIVIGYVNVTCHDGRCHYQYAVTPSSLPFPRALGFHDREQRRS